MSTKLICPDCGGVLGETEEGESACICFNDHFKSAQADHAADHAAGSEPDLAHETAAGAATLNDTQPVEVVTKICFKCGTDVRGHKRFKDSRGYLCAECNAKEVAAEKEGTALCQECSRRVRLTALVDFRGQQICKLCQNELRDADKKRIKVISGKSFAAEDRRQLKILIGVLVFLGILMLISAWRLIHGRI